MKHSGKARRAGFRIIVLSLIVGIALWALFTFAGVIATLLTAVAFAVVPLLLVVWLLFAAFTLYFFRDPEPRVPSGTGLVVSPAHGKVDAIGTTTEPQFMGGDCQRVSIFLSVVDVHVQNAPVTGKLSFVKYTMGQFLNAMRTDSAVYNENVLLGFDATDPKGQRIGVRLIAGVIARRIVTYVQGGEEVARGERISLIQFGSRADVYLPQAAKIKVRLGDRVVGGQTVLAAFE